MMLIVGVFVFMTLLLAMVGWLWLVVSWLICVACMMVVMWVCGVMVGVLVDRMAWSRLIWPATLYHNLRWIIQCVSI